MRQSARGSVVIIKDKGADDDKAQAKSLYEQAQLNANLGIDTAQSPLKLLKPLTDEQDQKLNSYLAVVKSNSEALKKLEQQVQIKKPVVPQKTGGILAFMPFVGASRKSVNQDFKLDGGNWCDVALAGIGYLIRYSEDDYKRRSEECKTAYDRLEQARWKNFDDLK